MSSATAPTSNLFSDIYLESNSFGIGHLVLDEAHFAKNFTTGTTHQAVKALAPQWVLQITGTFFDNHWTDIFGLLSLLPGHPFRTFDQFMHSFSTRSADNSRWLDPNAMQVEHLTKFLMRFVICRPSGTIATPDLNQKPVSEFMLSAEEARECAHFRKQFLSLVKAKALSHTASSLSGEAMALAQYAQQVAAHPALRMDITNLGRLVKPTSRAADDGALDSDDLEDGELRISKDDPSCKTTLAECHRS